MKIWLIIGYGSIAKKHISAIKKISKKNIVLIISRSASIENPPENVDYVCREIDQLQVIPNYAIIATPTSTHLDWLQKIISLNIPIFLEKPVFWNVSQIVEAQKLLPLINSMTYVGCNLRFLKGLVKLKKLISSGGLRIEEVNIYAGSDLTKWRPGTNFREGYSANPELGGGVDLDLIHEIDYCYWIFGKPLKVNKISTSKSSLKIKSFDFTNYLLEYPEFNANITLNYYRTNAKRSIEVIHSEGEISFNLLNNILDTGKDKQNFNDEIIDTYESQLLYFVECAQNGKTPINSIEEGIEVLKLALAYEC
jgi:predicted dehydrogenase